MGVITISRVPGSSGDTLARALAERLQYRLVERAELVQLAETIGGADVAWERSPELRERSPSFWERLNEERRRYASVLRRVTTHLAEQDRVVIVGLGAGQLLRGLRQVLRVQVVAPEDVRLERLMACGFEQAAGPLTRDQAHNLLRHRERESAAYIRYLFHIDWLEPQHWDLVLNTGRFSVADGVHVISAIVESGLLERRAADTRRLADLVLASHVESALLRDGGAWVSEPRVEAHDGRVRIAGEVFAEDDRETIEKIARSVDGVQRLETDLRIQPQSLTDM
jgi:cytidylate kinase